MRSLLQVMFVALFVPAALAAERWKLLPPTPAMVQGKSGYANINGIRIYYAVYGQGSPVILLHGGLANSDYWGNQIGAFAP